MRNTHPHPARVGIVALAKRAHQCQSLLHVGLGARVLRPRAPSRASAILVGVGIPSEELFDIPVRHIPESPVLGSLASATFGHRPNPRLSPSSSQRGISSVVSVFILFIPKRCLRHPSAGVSADSRSQERHDFLGLNVLRPRARSPTSVPVKHLHSLRPTVLRWLCQPLGPRT